MKSMIRLCVIALMMAGIFAAAATPVNQTGVRGGPMPGCLGCGIVN
jgi:hypothetical protein